MCMCHGTSVTFQRHILSIYIFIVYLIFILGPGDDGGGIIGEEVPSKWLQLKAILLHV